MNARRGHRPQVPTTPTYLLSGVNDAVLMSASLAMQLTLPTAVLLRHTIDPANGVLTRTVSDITGILERTEISLDHACVSCAIREDVVPMLERLAAEQRWSAVIGCLPATAEAMQVCRVLAWAPGNAPHVRMAGVVTALNGATIAADLLGSDLIAERGLATADDDDRALAEVACAMVEYADLLCVSEQPASPESALLTALARPGVPIVDDMSTLDESTLARGLHRHESTEAWVAEARDVDLPSLAGSPVWQLDLHSDRPFHPERFSEELATLGRGPHRSRGCFWLPTRPRDICAWDGAGGHASVGCSQRWESGQQPFTRIVVTGIDRGPDRRAAIESAFVRSLVTPEELISRGWSWNDGWDGLEAWLGPIDRAA